MDECRCFHPKARQRFLEAMKLKPVDGKNQCRLTDNPARDCAPAWSPDSQRIAFSSNRGGRRFFISDYEIYVMDADGRNQRNLTNNPADDYSPSWSPDGQRIAFVTGVIYEIYVMDADGKNPRRLTDNPADDWRPNWFDPAFAYPISPAGKLRATWGWLKRACP